MDDSIEVKPRYMEPNAPGHYNHGPTADNVATPVNSAPGAVTTSTNISKGLFTSMYENKIIVLLIVVSIIIIGLLAYVVFNKSSQSGDPPPENNKPGENTSGNVGNSTTSDTNIGSTYANNNGGVGENTNNNNVNTVINNGNSNNNPNNNTAQYNRTGAGNGTGTGTGVVQKNKDELFQLLSRSRQPTTTDNSRTDVEQSNIDAATMISGVPDMNENGSGQEQITPDEINAVMVV